MSRGRQDDVLTDYVRDRLDRLVAESQQADTPDEAGLRTVLRPRPGLNRTAGGSGAMSEWWVGETAPSDADASTESGGPVPVGGGGAGQLWRFTRQHLLVLGAILAIGVLLAAFALTRARAVPVDVPAPEVVAEPAPSPSPEVAPTPELMRVHVIGEVARPGVHQLPVGARVADAITAAGGLTPEARPGELNLAQALADGQQLVVGGPQQPSEVRGSGNSGGGVEGSGGTTSATLNLNTATAAQLDTLPGVGPVTAEKIVAWRTEHGRFTRIEELQEVPGIGPKTFAEIAPHVTV